MSAGLIQLGANLSAEEIMKNLEEIVAGLDASKINLDLPELNIAQGQTQSNEKVISGLQQGSKHNGQIEASKARNAFKSNATAPRPKGLDFTF